MTVLNSDSRFSPFFAVRPVEYESHGGVVKSTRGSVFYNNRVAEGAWTSQTAKEAKGPHSRASRHVFHHRSSRRSGLKVGEWF